MVRCVTELNDAQNSSGALRDIAEWCSEQSVHCVTELNEAQNSQGALCDRAE